MGAFADRGEVPPGDGTSGRSRLCSLRKILPESPALSCRARNRSSSIELLLDDPFNIHFQTFYLGGIPFNAEVQQFGITLLIIMLTIALSKVRWLQPINVIWGPILKIFGLLNYPLRLLAWPFRALIRLLGSRSQPTAAND